MTTVSRGLSHAIDKLSKNALADVLIDVIRGTVGADATESVVIENLQPFVDTVLRMRKDKPVPLAGGVAEWERHAADYKRRQAGQFTPEELEEKRRADAIYRDQLSMAGQIREHNKTAKVPQ